MSSDLPTTHRALVVDAAQKGWEVKEQPLPRYDDVLVRVHAVALNPTDWKHLGAIKPGGSVGSDFGGVVSRGAGGFKAGDRVAGFTRGGYLQYDNGAFAGNLDYIRYWMMSNSSRVLEYVAAQQAVLWRIPENITFEQAAALGGIPGDVSPRTHPIPPILTLTPRSVCAIMTDCSSGSLHAA